MMYQISTQVLNTLTGEVVVNGSFDMKATDYNFETMHANAVAMKEMMPDCTVSMAGSNGDFICLMALNQELDEKKYEAGEITFEEYTHKWYGAPTPVLAQVGIPSSEEWRQGEMLWEYMNGEYDDF